jgi:hypothetical protein
VQDGIDAAGAAALDCGQCQVWVAQGTYYIYETGDADTVALAADVAVYGGFSGDETALEERDPDPALTALDGRQSATGSSRVRHVVTGADDALLDGFTITEGAATDDTSEDPYHGGGVLVNEAEGMTLANCAVTGNYGYHGGGVAAILSTVELRDCTVANNIGQVGGGALIENSPAAIVNCVFSSNTADEGGGLWIFGSEVDILGSTFHGNSGFDASLMLVEYATVISASSVFWYNPLSTPGNVIEQNDADVWISYSIFQGGTAGPGNLNANPLFADADAGDYHLQAGSPAIDAADGAVLPEADIEGQARVDDPDTPNTGVGDPPYADMGAFEYQP